MQKNRQLALPEKDIEGVRELHLNDLIIQYWEYFTHPAHSRDFGFSDTR
jgi:hypothetical protein